MAADRDRHGCENRHSMELRLLGRFEVEVEGRDLTPRRPLERALLALLLLRSPRAVGVDELVDALWGDAPPATARTALHGLISGLRRLLGTDRLQTQPPGYRLHLRPDDRYDVDHFEGLVDDAAAAPAALRAQMLREALDLFRGEPFEGVDLAIDLHGEVARLEGRRLAAEEGQVAAELELGRHAAVLPRLERLVAEQPLHEGLRSQLMLALYRAGRQADALRVAQEARRILSTELGVEPGPALQRLEQQILEQDPALLASKREGTAQPGLVLEGGLATIIVVRAHAPHDGEPGAAHEAAADTAREVAIANGAVEVPTRRGPAFAFARAREAATSAAVIQRAARRSAISVGIGLHSGVTGFSAAPWAVADVATRLAELAHPGQVVLGRATRDLLREAPASEVDVRDLGEHRLSDLGPAQPLYQLVAPGLDTGFAATRGLEAMPTNLPVQASPFIAREAELDELALLLRDRSVRLVTLTGPGGTGKTRLALHAAAELLGDYPDGTWFVPLEAITDASLVPSSIASTLGIGGNGATSLEAIARELAGRQTLLVLDNFEQVLGAAGFVGDLLLTAPETAILVTSRAPLKLGGERVVPVGPLPVPSLPAPSHGAPATQDDAPAGADLSALLAVGSVALFTMRAAAVRPEFTLTPRDAAAVAELCRVLDGLPLAIELAASRVAVMAPGAVLERLDRPLRLLTARHRTGSPRHRALEATIEWSHDLLEPELQALFASLAVFAGGWTLEAAESVCGDVVDVVDGLARLVDQSLVLLGGSDADPRFRMLATIREFAAAKLQASELQAEAERRHASFFLGVAETAEPDLRGRPGSWLSRLESEHDNVRAALDRLARRSDGGAEDRDAAVTEARLAGSLWRFWYLAGHLEEGRARLEHALSIHPDATAARVKVLLGAAVMAQNADDAVAATERALEALELSRSTDDRWSAAYAQFMLANAARARARNDTARAGFEESVRAFRELGDDHSALLAARGLAGTLEAVGELDAARALYQDSLRRARAGDDDRLEASTLGALASMAFDEGRVTDATLLLRESLRLHRELGDRLDSALDLGRAARTLAMGGQPAEAAQLLGMLAAIRGELGLRGRAVEAMADDTRATLRRQLPLEQLDRLIDEGARLRFEAALDLALQALA